MGETIWDSLDRILGMSAMGASATSHEAAKRGREMEANALVFRERIAELERQVAVTREALRKLANEAQGFMSQADPMQHGITNIQVLSHWIENALAATAILKGGA